LSIDLYTLYVILWVKYKLYLTFALKEFARVGLALSVTYQIIFEINTLQPKPLLQWAQRNLR
jgi:hypothetical protein